MKKLFILITFITLAISGYGQTFTGGIFLRVNDSTTYRSSASTVAQHASGQHDIYWNNQATTPHYDVYFGPGTNDYYHVKSLGWAPTSGGGGSVTSVSGTSNRVTSTGGSTPVIDISATFEALLAKRAERIDQNNAATTSAQLATTLSDESGTGVVVYSASPTFTGTPLAPTAADGTNTTQIATTAFVKNTTPKVYNVKSYGAVGDAITFTDGKITTGTPNFTSASATFTVADVGKVFVFAGAGAAGAVLRTTISAYVSATAVTLANNASTTVGGAGKTFIYGSDDTPEIQSAESAVFAAGGGRVYFPTGHYLINGALQTSVGGVNPNCQIYVESQDPTLTTRVSIEFVGETGNFLGSGYASSAINALKNSGVILTSTIDGSGTNPSILSTKGPNVTYEYLSATDIRVQNMEFRVFTNGGASAPTMSGLNFQYFAKASGKNIVVGLDVTNQISSSASGSEVFGILSGSVNNTGPNNWEEVIVSGFKYGFVTGEHTILDNVYAFACNNGFAIPEMNYVVSGQLLTHGCINQILFPSTSILGLSASWNRMTVDLIVEVEKDVFSLWYDTQTFIKDDGNQATGTIKYTYVNGNGTGALINGEAYTASTGLSFLNLIPINSFAGTGGAITANTNNYANASNAISKDFQFTPNANWSLSGIDLDYYYYFRTFTITNLSTTFFLQLLNDNSGSTAGNRFLMSSGNDLVLMPGQTVYCQYDPLASAGTGRIRVMAPAGVMASSNQYPLQISSTYSGISGVYQQGTINSGGPAYYWDNNRGTFASYGFAFQGGSTNATSLLGSTSADMFVIASAGASSAGMKIGTSSADPLIISTNDTERGRFLSGGQFGLGVTAPTAILHLKAGTTAASTAPLKFNTGTSMTAAEAGAMEFTTDDLFFTITTGTARKRFAFADPVGGLTSGRIPYATTNGRLTDASTLTFDGTSMTMTGKTIYDATITAGGTTGNQTINKPSGTVNIAAAETTVTVTDSFCTTSSIVLAVIRTNDATAYIKNVVPGAGSFVINLGAAATAEVSIGFIVHN